MEQFFVDNSIYIVLAIVLMIWVGLGAYTMVLDTKLKGLEKRIAEDEE